MEKPRAAQRPDEPEEWRVFQRRGTPQILLLLSDGSSLRSSEIDAAIPTIKRQILGTRLNELRELGILEREVEEGPPMISRYRVTEKGTALAEVAEALNRVVSATPLAEEDAGVDVPRP
ncbi:MAG TPA: winged helix-turn-helix transcriptional regulator [Solirubrobacterales bacterium]|jgi:DNA-binding HxlR family transcriptional regulator|nr:winged helix-turn-helix transcriptional regulator [Solirubrobacterales bacterium]HNC92719.1 winged helix-turn-helix transcriptional regulator [Solirubrobacterales bacterium]HNE78555.1 winged helix-turn-helix transcriptional regulator [Solirubrobacterales bacterium]HNI40589.1 winged helix-turn-helix transcriptional regulator [Solirubrobacterales bacterium]HNK36054.1 winged helix-turn-helix transcriptional regulator [Solirubrobacterales bacterium]